VLLWEHWHISPAVPTQTSTPGSRWKKSHAQLPHMTKAGHDSSCSRIPILDYRLQLCSFCMSPPNFRQPFRLRISRPGQNKFSCFCKVLGMHFGKLIIPSFSPESHHSEQWLHHARWSLKQISFPLRMIRSYMVSQWRARRQHLLVRTFLCSLE
jgi:hypothetical protein